MIIKAIPSGYFRDFQDLKMLLKNSFELLISISKMFIGIFSTININKDRMMEAVKNSFILALDLAEFLVQEKNIPFRQSHEIVALLVKTSQYPDDLFNKEKIENVIFSITKKKINLSEESIESLKDLKQCLDKRVSQGGSSIIEVEKNIKSLEERKKILFSHYQKRIDKINNADNLRKNLINKLIT